jgi:hypothetical protein
VQGGKPSDEKLVGTHKLVRTWIGTKLKRIGNALAAEST